MARPRRRRRRLCAGPGCRAASVCAAWIFVSNPGSVEIRVSADIRPRGGCSIPLHTSPPHRNRQRRESSDEEHVSVILRADCEDSPRGELVPSLPVTGGENERLSAPPGRSSGRAWRASWRNVAEVAPAFVSTAATSSRGRPAGSSFRTLNTNALTKSLMLRNARAGGRAGTGNITHA